MKSGWIEKKGEGREEVGHERLSHKSANWKMKCGGGKWAQNWRADG